MALLCTARVAYWTVIKYYIKKQFHPGFAFCTWISLQKCTKPSLNIKKWKLDLPFNLIFFWNLEQVRALFWGGDTICSVSMSEISTLMTVIFTMFPQYFYNHPTIFPQSFFNISTIFQQYFHNISTIFPTIFLQYSNNISTTCVNAWDFHLDDVHFHCSQKL